MTCGGCASKVGAQVGALDGVTGVDAIRPLVESPSNQRMPSTPTPSGVKTSRLDTGRRRSFARGYPESCTSVSPLRDARR
ncbi:heavy-metal-associated domain-containing protein [Nocardia sp. KC 131]|uniref:heavy-metal-associated domain-containing protein n=1 Tax=Nocardia arseniciresistens TaxID=3392119 RepID=UPI00398F094D